MGQVDISTTFATPTQAGGPLLEAVPESRVPPAAYLPPATRSAKGTRLNRRGLATRGRILDVAVELLAAGGPDAVSANLIARAAGVTWGTIQHQFGEADGVWAAVIEHVSARPDLYPATARLALLPLGTCLETIIEEFWRSLDSPGAQAVGTLRLFLRRDQAEVERDYPRTAAALAAWDTRWAEAWDRAFERLHVPRDRLAKARSLLPCAVRGLHDAGDLGGCVDIPAGRAGLVEALTLYLS